MFDQCPENELRGEATATMSILSSHYVTIPFVVKAKLQTQSTAIDARVFLIVSLSPSCYLGLFAPWRSRRPLHTAEKEGEA